MAPSPASDIASCTAGRGIVVPSRSRPSVIAELRRICPLDVDHLPAEIDLIERFQRLLPGLPQVACFDTGFHHDMPRVAQIVAIPRRYEAAGVRRYGFHGLSYAYLMKELERLVGREAAGWPGDPRSPGLGGQPRRRP